MAIQQRFRYASNPKRNNTLENYLALTTTDIINETERINEKIDASLAAISGTSKATLTNDASTYITVGDRREDLKITVDYLTQRGSVIEDGTVTLLPIVLLVGGELG